MRGCTCKRRFRAILKWPRTGVSYCVLWVRFSRSSRRVAVVDNALMAALRAQHRGQQVLGSIRSHSSPIVRSRVDRCCEEFASWKWELPIRISHACGWGLPDSNEFPLQHDV